MKISYAGRRKKGYRHENSTAKRWRARGLKCQRMPLSGALGGVFAGDLQAVLGGQNLIIQLKSLADGWKGIYSAIRDHDLLIIKSDNKDALVVIPEALFLTLICGEEQDGTASERIRETTV